MNAVSGCLGVWMFGCLDVYLECSESLNVRDASRRFLFLTILRVFVGSTVLVRVKALVSKSREGDLTRSLHT